MSSLVTLPEPARSAAARADPGTDWMLSFQAGDEAAYDRLVDRYWPGVRRFLLHAVRDAGRADDLAQDVFVRVYRSRARYRPTASFRTWLFTIAIRLSMNEARARRRRRRVFRDAPATRDDGEDPLGGFWANVPDTRMETPLECLERKEMEELIDGLVERLPPSQRAAIDLQRTEDLSYKEMAEALEVSVPALKSLLVRARESLKEGVERYVHGKGGLRERKP